MLACHSTCSHALARHVRGDPCSTCAYPTPGRSHAPASAGSHRPWTRQTWLQVWCESNGESVIGGRCKLEAKWQVWGWLWWRHKSGHAIAFSSAQVHTFERRVQVTISVRALSLARAMDTGADVPMEAGPGVGAGSAPTACAGAGAGAGAGMALPVVAAAVPATVTTLDEPPTEALMEAVFTRDLDLARLAIKAGADVNHKNAVSGRRALCQWLPPAALTWLGGLRAAVQVGMSPLCMAANTGPDSLVRELVAAGANVSDADNVSVLGVLVAAFTTRCGII